MVEEHFLSLSLSRSHHTYPRRSFILSVGFFLSLLSASSASSKHRHDFLCAERQYLVLLISRALIFLNLR